MNFDLAPLRQALQEHLQEEDDQFGVLTGYMVIGQWSAANGDQFLTKTAGDINDEAPPVWFTKGLLYHALETVQRDADAGGGDDEN